MKKNPYCYECDPNRKGGSNHVKCVIRLGRKKQGGGKHVCHCWCLDLSSKYENVFPPKELVIIAK